RQLLAARAGGLTAQQLFDEVVVFAAAGAIADQARFVWRAGALLELQPELSGKLAALFEQPGMSGDGRAMILDLLAAAGHAQAQAAMRRSLASPAAREKPQAFAELVQPLGLVDDPGPQ